MALLDEGSYTSADVQSAYSLVPADTANNKQYCMFKFSYNNWEIIYCLFAA